MAGAVCCVSASASVAGAGSATSSAAAAAGPTAGPAATVAAAAAAVQPVSVSAVCLAATAAAGPAGARADVYGRDARVRCLFLEESSRAVVGCIVFNRALGGVVVGYGV